MSKLIAVVGDSGTGKSRSLINLNPKETFLINVAGKDLPFKGWRKMYTPVTKENLAGNYFSSDTATEIIACLNDINENRPHIKTVILDDAQYIMSMEFMRKAKVKGYDKFTDVAYDMFSVLDKARSLREDLNVIILTHDEADRDAFGNLVYRKIKTVGKMVDQYIKLEGLMTVVLFTEVERNKETKMLEYKFITQSDGTNSAKSPEGMFESVEIPNDLDFVLNKMEEYYG